MKSKLTTHNSLVEILPLPLLRIYENLTGSFTPSLPLPGFNRGLT
jgi:hypothetical protein